MGTTPADRSRTVWPQNEKNGTCCPFFGLIIGVEWNVGRRVARWSLRLRPRLKTGVLVHTSRILPRVLGLIVLLIGGGVEAGSIVGVALRPSVPVEGAADQIEVLVEVEADDGPMTLEVRASRVADGSDGEAVPVDAERPEDRDDDGHFLRSKAVPKTDGPGLIEVVVEIPVASFDLPDAGAMVGYEVRLVAGGEVVSAAGSPLSFVGGPRAGAAAEIAPGLPSAPSEMPVPPGKGAPIARPPIEPPAPAMAIPMPEGDVSILLDPASERGRFEATMATRAFVPLADALGDPNKRVVHYVTNRAEVARSGNPGDRFGNDLAVGQRLSFGQCVINIPIEHVRGNVEVPGRFNFWDRENRRKFFLIESTRPLTLEQLLRQLRAGAGPKDVLVYIHGFNNSIDGALLRLGQIAYDTGFSGRSVLFSWPSGGSPSPLMYLHDEDVAEVSGADLARFLRQLARDKRDEGLGAKIHLLAHSMGNRVLLDAMTLLSQDADIDRPFGQVVLAAPDVDRARFRRQADPLDDLADSVTLYYNPNDLALRASLNIPGHGPRLGMSSIFIDDFVLENVDAQFVDTTRLGHGYFSGSSEVLSDLRLLFLDGLRAGQRWTLREPSPRPNPPYWQFFRPAGFIP